MRFAAMPSSVRFTIRVRRDVTNDNYPTFSDIRALVAVVP